MTIFREANSPDGKPGPVSLRRVMAAFLALSGVGLGVFSMTTASTWQVTAMALGVPIGAALVLLFFTTWSDVASLVKAVKDVQ